MISIAPITREKIDEEWIAMRREIIVRDGYALRAGGDACIEAKSLHTNAWDYVTLPGGARCFDTVEARDDVLRRLEGRKA